MPKLNQVRPTLSNEEILERLNELGPLPGNPDDSPDASPFDGPVLPPPPSDAGPLDLAKATELAWIRLLVGDEPVRVKDLQSTLAAKREALGWAKAPLLERMLVDRVVMCWLQLQHADFMLAGSQDAEPVWARMAADRVTSCQKRHQEAIAALTANRGK